MRIGFATWTKDRLCIADALAVQRLAFAASQSKNFFERLALTRRIVQTLCTHSAWFSVFFYQRIIKSFGFKHDERAKEDDIESVEKQILNFCSDIGSRCGKLPNEVAEGTTFDEANIYYRHLILRYLENAMSNAMSSAPMPEYIKQLSDRMRNVQREIESAGRATKRNEEQYMLRDFFPRFA